jgi:hypothetical protein
MIHFILRLLSPGYRKTEARMRELDQIRDQMDFWHAEIEKLQAVASDAVARGDRDTFIKAKRAYEVASWRYTTEVIAKL